MITDFEKYIEADLKTVCNPGTKIKKKDLIKAEIAHLLNKNFTSTKPISDYKNDG